MSDTQEPYLLLGWDVGGTKSAVIVATSAGEVVERSEWPSNAEEGPDRMLPDFFRQVAPVLERYPQINDIGVSIGGPMNALTGVILSPPHLPGWDQTPLAEIIRRELGLEPAIEHDAVACLLAEWLWGGAVGTTHAAYITCGTGCGAGLLVDGRVLRGPDGQSPEVGHIRIADDGPVVFGKNGSVESFCSGVGVSELGMHMFPEVFSAPVDTRTLLADAEGGDAKAREVLLESARYTGIVCAMLGDIFSPQVIVLGSLARYFGEWWLVAVRETFAVEALPLNGGHTRIIAPVLGDALQDLSAVAPCVFRR